MSHKRQGQLTVSDEWARHLRPGHRRAFWKQERRAERALIRDEVRTSGEPVLNATVPRTDADTPDPAPGALEDAP